MSLCGRCIGGKASESISTHWKSGVQSLWGVKIMKKLPGGQKNTGVILQSTQPAYEIRSGWGLRPHHPELVPSCLMSKATGSGLVST